MANSRVVDKCNQHIVPIIENLGYDVIEVEYAKKVDGMNLTFFIDKKEGISLNDCEIVNNAITDKLDEINVTDDASYILNVSSAGLDRPIKNQKDFARNKNKLVEIKLFVPQNGQKIFQGTLVDMNDETITLQVDETILQFNRKQVAICTPVINF